MTGKEYFLHIKSLLDERDSLIRLVNELAADATAIGGFDYAKPVVQSSPKNVTEEKIIEIADTMAKLNCEIERSSAEVLEAEKRLTHLSRPEYAQVIRFRYIHRKRKGWIADEMHTSERNVERLLSKGLKQFESMFL